MELNPVTQGVRQGILQQGQPPQDQQGNHQYEQLMDNVSKVIDGEKGLTEAHKQIMKMLQQGAQNPAEALAMATLAAGEGVFKQAQSAGVEITDDQLVAAAMDTITSLTELAEEAGFFTASDEDVAKAYGLALMGWMKAHPDMIDWQGLQASMAQMDPQEVEQAKQQGDALFGGGPQAAPLPPQGGPPPQAGPQGGILDATQ